MKVFLAAVETNTEHSIAASRAKAKHVLTSYYHARDKPVVKRTGQIKGEWLACMRQAKDRFIDSGAFTLRTAVLDLVNNKGDSAARNDGVDYDQYLAEYCDWLKWTVRQGLADVWVEMDIGAVTGQNWVLKQRDVFLRAGLGYGLINVWHSEYTWQDWIDLLDESCRPGRSRYVAIEGHQNNREKLSYTTFLRAAYDRGVRVHGSRMTTTSELKKWPFYSVDSTSWLFPTLAGCNIVTTIDGNLHLTRGKTHKAGDVKWRSGGPPRGSTRAQRLLYLTESAKEWVKVGDQLNQYWIQRGVDWERQIAKLAA
jgi:hypothetical protein